VLQRVIPELLGMKNILVIDDEAHHCYRHKEGEPGQWRDLQFSRTSPGES
jgi:type III restriction enzyme